MGQLTPGPGIIAPAEDLVGTKADHPLDRLDATPDLAADPTQWIDLPDGTSLCVEAGHHQGQACWVLTQSAPIASKSSLTPPSTGSFGVQTCIQQVQEKIALGHQLSLVVVDLKKANLLRSELSLLEYTHLMAALQAKLAVLLDAPPEPITDNSFLIPLQMEGQAAASLSERALATIATTVLVPELPHVMTGAGVIEVADDDDDPTGLLQKVYDLAGEATEGEVKLHRVTTAEMALKDPVRALQTALHNQQCELLFQPAIALNACDDEMYEVLTQMRDEQGHAVPARLFIRDAARRELGQMLDQYVIDHAMRALLQHLPLNPRTKVVINLTLSSLQSGDLVHQIQGLTLSQRDKSRVVFQFRETDIVLDQQTSQMHISSLSSLGFGVACAQFGNLPNPHRLLDAIRFDWIKLDASFIEGIKSDAAKQQALNAMVAGIHAKGPKVIAPMVEQPAILSNLYKSGVDLIQGHLMSPPRPQMDYQFEEEI